MSKGESTCRAKFLMDAACAYSRRYPEISSHLGSHLVNHLPGRLLGNRLLCQHCSAPFTPDTSSTRTLTSSKLRRKRRRDLVRGVTSLKNAREEGGGVAGSRGTRKCRTYLVVRCKLCRHSSIIDGLPRESSRPNPPKDTPVCRTPSAQRSAGTQGNDAVHPTSGRRGYLGMTTPSPLSNSIRSTFSSWTPPSATPKTGQISKMSSLVSSSRTSSPTISCTHQLQGDDQKPVKTWGDGVAKSKRSKKMKKRLSLKDALELTDAHVLGRSTLSQSPGLEYFMFREL